MLPLCPNHWEPNPVQRCIHIFRYLNPMRMHFMKQEHNISYRPRPVDLSPVCQNTPQKSPPSRTNLLTPINGDGAVVKHHRMCPGATTTVLHWYGYHYTSRIRPVRHESNIGVLTRRLTHTWLMRC